MKKIIPLFLMLLFTGGFLFAQQAQTTKPAQEKTKTVKKDANHSSHQAVKANPSQNQSSSDIKAAPEKTNANHLKKDGAPDKRYKENKQHVKKDGTPDKRFKENKQQ